MKYRFRIGKCDAEYPLTAFGGALPKGEPIFASPFGRGGSEADGEGY
ncbi:MAG: hypothetical protein IKT54_02375 [Clostridia bacterium]|nr:hypothetical protein [Clostridia bacterium]